MNPSDQLSFDLAGEPKDAPVVDAIVDDDVLRPEQRAVVELASDFVVTAGAGSGKTRTLVALYSARIAE